jgi:hypothetical protein
MSYVGIYGAFYVCTRAQAAVGVKYIWQTEAWSGGNITSAVNIMQRNGLGYTVIDGVQCDVNEAHTDDIGAFVLGAPAPVPAPTPTPAPAVVQPLTNAQMQDLFNMVSIIFQQVAGVVPGLPLLPGSPTPFPATWPATLADVLALTAAKTVAKQSTRKRA